MTTHLVVASCFGVLASMALLFFMRRGTVGYDPPLFAKVAAAVMVVTFVAFLAAVVQRAVAAILFTGGLLLVYGGGMANFLYGLQGYALLTELEHVGLAEGRELQEFDAGPMSDVSEMNLALQLEKLDLRLVDGAIQPASRIRLIRKGQPVNVVTVKPGTDGRDGTLRFMQGAYGFAPRIVITRNGNAVFDRYVPFTTRRIEGQGIAFEETFSVASENMSVRSALNLLSAADEMKGHARLGVSVTRDGKNLGRGELSIGHFAKLNDGSHIGYAGLKRWSEIDVARRNYPEPMYAGAALILLAVAAWPVMRWRR